MFLRHNQVDRLTSSFIHRIFNNVTNRHLSRTYYRRIKQVSNVNRSACFLWWAINTPCSLWYFGGNLYGMPRRQLIWNTAKVRVVYSIERALETLCCVLKRLFRFKLVRYRLISNCAKLKSQAYRQLVCRYQFIVDLSFIFQCCVWSFFLIL